MTHPDKVILPKLRKDLTIAFNDYDWDGKPQWTIYDAARNKFFIIGWPEYEIISRWDLGDPEKIIHAVNEKTTLNINSEDIDNLIRFLANNFLFRESGYSIQRKAREQQLFKEEHWFHWLIMHYLFFRIPIVHPDKFLVSTKIIGDILFSRITFIIMSFLGVIALYGIGLRWEDFTHTFPSILSWQGIALYGIVFVVCKLLHEMGHAYMCRSFGIPVPTLGVAFLVFFPVFYTDTTLSWSLKSRKRMRIALAGVWVETYIAIIAALIWSNTHDPTIETIAYIVVAVNWVASLLINASPFMRFDGYYVLADFLKMPNLQPRAFALTRWQIRKWLFGLETPPPEKFSRSFHRLLVTYSILTWLYRLTIYIGIAVLVYHFFVKIIGILLFIIELYYFLLGPFVNEFKTWYASRNQFIWNKNTIITTSVFIFLILIFFLPINETIKLPATMSYEHRSLIAPEEGIIASNLPVIGTTIKANQPIITIDSPPLDHELENTYLNYMKSSKELRRASVDQKYGHQKKVLLSEISKEQAQYNKSHAVFDKLTLSVPFDGTLIELASDLKQGTYVVKNEWLGDIASPAIIRVEAFAKQDDMHLIKQRSKGYFYPTSINYSRVPVQVAFIDVLNVTALDCTISQEVQLNKTQEYVVDKACYNASDLGGGIATYNTTEGRFVPIDSTYRILLTTSTPIKLTEIQRGVVVLKTTSHSYAGRLFRAVKTVLVAQSGF